ncbi:MAG: hypothetical protein WBL68_10160 [Nitrososphaeraceae archaeon]
MTLVNIRLTYSSISEGKNEEQNVERLDGDRKLVKIWVGTLQQIGFINQNSFNKLVVMIDGKNYLNFDLYR